MTESRFASWLEFSAEALDQFFPFHLRLSSEGQILNCGPSLRKILKSGIPQGGVREIFEVLDLLGEADARDFGSLGLPSGHAFLLRHRSSGLQFKTVVRELVPGAGKFFAVLAPPVHRLEELGKLGLQFTDFPPTDGVVDFLMLLHSTQQTTLELLNAQKRTEQQGRLAESLARISLTFAESQDLSTVFQKVLREICLTLDWKIGHLFWVERDEQGVFLLDSGYWHLADPAAYDAFAKATREIRFRPGQGMPGVALETGRLVWRKEVPTGVPLPRSAAFNALGLQSGVALPVRVDGRVQAVLEFFQVSNLENEAELIRFFEVLHSQLGLLLERQISEEKIRKSASELKVFFDSMRIGAFFMDAESGLVLRANPALTEMLACSREAIQQLHFADFSFDVISGAPLQVATLRSGRYLFSRADGSQFYGELWIKRLSSGIGGISGSSILAFITDLTERERSMALAAENSALLRTAAMKDEFLSSMSHELRTPLNSILGLTEVLLQGLHGELGAPQKNALSIVDSSARHLLALINDILDLSKIESGKMQLTLESISLETVVQETLLLFKESTLKRGIRLFVESFAGLPRIEGDARRIKQVLVNLIGNAQKFTSEGGTIGLSPVLSPDRSVVHVTVWDTGIGIAAADIPKLFQSFVQLDGGLSRNQGGTGLGLNLVAKLVGLHRGSVDVRSVEGKGTAFAFSLPVNPNLTQVDGDAGRAAILFRSPLSEPELEAAVRAAARPSPLAQPPLQASSAPLAQPPLQASSAPPAQPLEASPEARTESVIEKVRILLIENDPGNAAFMGDFLRSSGFEVVHVEGGPRALEWVGAEGMPGLVLLDMQLPEMDGFEIVRQLRGRPGGLEARVVAVTSLAMPGDEARCLRAGCDSYFAKPVNLGKLLQKLRGYKSR